MTRAHTLILDGIWGRPWRWEHLRGEVETRLGPATIYRYDDSGFVTFEQLGAQLATEIRRHADECGEINVVGYSMGGIVIRAAHLIDSSLPLRRAVFMNAPHGGSWMACLLPGMAGVKQLRPFDPYMKRVAAHEWNVPTLNIWNPIDGVIVPGRNTKWAGADEQVCCTVPIHAWPAWSRKTQQRVVDFLAAGTASRAVA